MSVSNKVWTTFSGRNGELKFSILNAPEDRLEEAIDLYITHYLAGESISKAVGIKDNEEALKEYREFASGGLFKHNEDVNIMICCLVNEDGRFGDIVGASFSNLSRADKPLNIDDINPQTKEVQKMLTLSLDMMSLYSIINEHGIDKSYDGWGIIVLPEYRGLGIAQEFLTARRLLSKEERVPITGAWMTSIGTQKAASRVGYETVLELNLEEFGKKHDVVFKDAPDVFKFMIDEETSGEMFFKQPIELCY